tara:strand:+ start:87 stop:713 length:627 start_codon:yes stop_codon:yes gene_type:complete
MNELKKLWEVIKEVVYIFLVLSLVFGNIMILYFYLDGGLYSDWVLLGLFLDAIITFLLFIIFVDPIKKSFKKFMHNKLFYISVALTTVATIVFVLLLGVQYGDGEASLTGKSTKDGFVLYSFFLIYLAPSISWLIYYLATRKWLTDFIKAQKFKAHEKNQAAKKDVKKSKAIKEIKEAKELLDLGVITQAEYDELAEKLKPIILENKP